MSFLQLCFKRAIKLPLLNNFTRSFAVTPVVKLKEIKQTQENNNVTIEGILVKSPREEFQLEELKKSKQNGEKFCPKCSLGLDVKHTDVLILSQYVRSDGCMLPRRITGLCRKQQKRMFILVAMAQKAGLMSNLTPFYSSKDPKKRQKWKKFNIYFEENKTKELKYL
uniref:Putative mitochondrial ribosomal protein s18a n=1 Tax=Nyssomyia neivai TaxID=330878 RepID=A0A1L8E0W2_9DIPT